MTAETALQQSIFENSVIIGEDTDLLCHWIAYLNEHKISFTLETKANSKERARTWHSICCLQLGYSTAEFTGYPCDANVLHSWYWKRHYIYKGMNLQKPKKLQSNFRSVLILCNYGGGVEYLIMGEERRGCSQDEIIKNKTSEKSIINCEKVFLPVK